MVETVNAGDKQVSRSAIVNMPAAEIFAMVVNPHRHHELDGSGTVGENISGPDRLTVGAKFGTHMKQFGMKYRTTSTITRVEDNAVVEWQLGIGQKWRWELEALGPDQTRVTETWDIREIPAIAAFGMRVMGMFNRNAKGIEETLKKLQESAGR